MDSVPVLSAFITEDIPFLLGVFIVSFAFGLAVRRWFAIGACLLLAIPYLGVGLGLLEGGDVPNSWVPAMILVVSSSALGLTVGVAIGRMITTGRLFSSPRN